MDMTQMVLAVSQSNPDEAEFVFETLTAPKLTKKSRATGEPTAFRLEIRSRFRARLGADYSAKVNEALAAKGEPADFEARKPSGKHYVNGTNWLMESDKTPGRFYVALSGISGKSDEYLVDGVPAGEDRIADLKANYMSKRPAEAPLVEWRTYSLESVVSCRPA